jgi:hypothetical protein
MSETRLIALSAAALVVACLAGWGFRETPARATPTTVQIDPFKVMTSAKQLPTEPFADYRASGCATGRTGWAPIRGCAPAGSPR